MAEQIEKIKLSNGDSYKLAEYDYLLPAELIAQEPLTERDRSRLLVFRRKNRDLEHSFFYELPSFLREGDLLVLNNTRVIPARLIGRKPGTGGKIEVFLLRKLADGRWETLVRPGRRALPGSSIILDGLEAVVEEIVDNGHRIISFGGNRPLESILHLIGKVPLPPYIKKDLDNPESYQTVYSKIEGSVAAPTAGFHFTEDLFKQLIKRNIRWVFLTLHIGAATFQPVKTDDIREHVMHVENYTISAEAAEEVNRTRDRGGRVIAVGTSSCRAMESNVDEKGRLLQGEGRTDLFIYPGYSFRITDALLTNFHLPRSTLLMLVSAFAGKNEVMQIYHEAVQKRYRFYSFGDAMLVL
ncbi:MAG: tRNA preQ1(34) S-adenosylmethionine ribosyltransferase-isomerase QueA [Dethiobacteria bacterium]